ncbi:MAG: hypothetical protein HYS22_02175 [Deltaproteobacteria bacterium]|nr:hypothetical protein [Deltaproteobacteria bacterium]
MASFSAGPETFIHEGQGDPEPGPAVSSFYVDSATSSSFDYLQLIGGGGPTSTAASPGAIGGGETPPSTPPPPPGGSSGGKEDPPEEIHRSAAETLALIRGLLVGPALPVGPGVRYPILNRTERGKLVGHNRSLHRPFILGEGFTTVGKNRGAILAVQRELDRRPAEDPFQVLVIGAGLHDPATADSPWVRDRHPEAYRILEWVALLAQKRPDSRIDVIDSNGEVAAYFEKLSREEEHRFTLFVSEDLLPYARTVFGRFWQEVTTDDEGDLPGEATHAFEVTLPREALAMVHFQRQSVVHPLPATGYDGVDCENVLYYLKTDNRFDRDANDYLSALALRNIVLNLREGGWLSANFLGDPVRTGALGLEGVRGVEDFYRFRGVKNIPYLERREEGRWSLRIPETSSLTAVETERPRFTAAGALRDERGLTTPALPELIEEIAREIASDFYETGRAGLLSLESLDEGMGGWRVGRGERLKDRLDRLRREYDIDARLEARSARRGDIADYAGELDRIAERFRDEVIRRLGEDHSISFDPSGLRELDLSYRRFVVELCQHWESIRSFAHYHSEEIVFVLQLFGVVPELELSTLEALVRREQPSLAGSLNSSLTYLRGMGILTMTVTPEGVVIYRCPTAAQGGRLRSPKGPVPLPDPERQEAVKAFVRESLKRGRSGPGELSSTETEMALRNLGKVLRLVYGFDPYVSYLDTHLANHLATPLLGERRLLGALDTLQFVLRWMTRNGDEMEAVAGRLESIFEIHDPEVMGRGNFVNSPEAMVEALVLLADGLRNYRRERAISRPTSSFKDYLTVAGWEAGRTLVVENSPGFPVGRSFLHEALPVEAVGVDFANVDLDKKRPTRLVWHRADPAEFHVERGELVDRLLIPDFEKSLLPPDYPVSDADRLVEMGVHRRGVVGLGLQALRAGGEFVLETEDRELAEAVKGGLKEGGFFREARVVTREGFFFPLLTKRTFLVVARRREISWSPIPGREGPNSGRVVTSQGGPYSGTVLDWVGHADYHQVRALYERYQRERFGKGPAELFGSAGIVNHTDRVIFEEAERLIAALEKGETGFERELSRIENLALFYREVSDRMNQRGFTVTQELVFLRVRQQRSDLTLRLARILDRDDDDPSGSGGGTGGTLAQGSIPPEELVSPSDPSFRTFPLGDSPKGDTPLPGQDLLTPAARLFLRETDPSSRLPEGSLERAIHPRDLARVRWERVNPLFR